MLMILPAPCPALLRPLLITEERKEREELEEEEGRVVPCCTPVEDVALNEAELRLKFKIELEGGLPPPPDNEPIIQNYHPVSIQKSGQPEKVNTDLCLTDC